MFQGHKVRHLITYMILKIRILISKIEIRATLGGSETLFILIIVRANFIHITYSYIRSDRMKSNYYIPRLFPDYRILKFTPLTHSLRQWFFFCLVQNLHSKYLDRNLIVVYFVTFRNLNDEVIR